MALLRHLLEMLEQRRRETGESLSKINERAQFPRQYLDKVLAGVEKNPDFRIDIVTAARLADVLDHRLMVIPNDLVPDVEALLARRPPELDPDTRIASMEAELSERSRRALCTGGVRTVGDLCERTQTDLLRIKGFGPGCLKEIEKILGAHGLALKGGGR